MTEDGLIAMSYRTLLERLSGFNIKEDEGEAAEAIRPYGCRVLIREMMGLGTPSVVVRVEGDDAVIRTSEIKHILDTLGLSCQSFRHTAS